MTVQLQTRNAGLEDMVGLLQDQHGRKIDMVAPASKIRLEDGAVVVKGVEATIDDDGVTQSDGRYQPTRVFDEGMSEKFGVPLSYVRRMRADRVDLLDANVNGWLHGRRAKMNLRDQTVTREAIPGDDRSFLIRAFRGDDGEVGVARALLSNQYAVMDNLDVLTAALDGVKQAGVEVDIAGCDLSDRRMYVRIRCPEVKAYALPLLKDYRSPFSGNRGDENPTVFAGLQISNSEVGSGAFSIVPRMIIEVCNNGLTVQKDAMRAVHLGSRMDEGVVRWSEDTERKNIDLVTAKARDAVATFLDAGYMERVIRKIEEDAGAPVTDAEATITEVSKRLRFSEEHRKGILDHFISGGSLTAGGVMGAVTSYAQVVEDADAAADMESVALTALDHAVSLA